MVHLHFRHWHPVRDALPEPVPAPQKTIWITSYQTLDPTFTEPVAGLSTMSQAAATTSNAPVAALAVASSSASSSAARSSASAQAQVQLSSSSSSLASVILAGSSTVDSTIPLATASATVASTRSSTASATSTSTSTSQSSELDTGMSTAGKAGLAIGIILGLGALLSLLLFCIRQRKKKENHQRIEDEKSAAHDAAFSGARNASTRTARTASTAPRLSLRPVTQFLPNLGERRSSRGNDLAMATANNGHQLAPQSAWERPSTSASQHDTANPFGSHAETIDPVNAAGAPSVQVMEPGGAIVAPTGAAIAAAAAAGGLARKASRRENAPKHLDLTKQLPGIGPPSPAGTEFSMSETPNTPMQTSGGAAIAAAGGPQNTAVHRVQLDFVPSMEDELELKAGQLIRLLHEYDDGWALCIRLDRSQQGVVPRTCLSTRPVKPRMAPNGSPRGPPPGMRVPQQGRPSSPAMNQGPRPGSAQSNRGPGPQYSPTGSRTFNGPQQGRPASPAGQRRLTPPHAQSSLPYDYDGSGGSPDRKAIPGQAL